MAVAIGAVIALADAVVAVVAVSLADVVPDPVHLEVADFAFASVAESCR